MRIHLRAFEPEDYKLTSQWRADPEITDLLGGNLFYVSSEREKKWVEEKIFNDVTNIYLAICLNENQDMIGYLSITSLDLRNRKAELGIIIGRKDLWNQGYAREAIRLGLEHLFFQLNLRRVHAYVLEEHESSLALFRRSGFIQEGILRDNVFKNGRFHNMVVLSILEDEFKVLTTREKA
ncbi:MAG TPA: GNAT family protein [Anaerolineales bacterium]|nr:GNAT family protein [Anaerolineales bacterium]